MKGFLLYSTDDGMAPPWEYLPCGAITPQVGLCLSLNKTTGYLAVSETPEYISMRREDAVVAAGTKIPVVRIQKGQVWEASLDGTTNYKAGEAADIDATGMMVDGDSNTDKVFQLTYLAGNTAGNSVRGRFVK